MSSTPFLAPLPHATRKEAFTALFEFIKKIPSPDKQQWKLFSQFLVDWDQVPAANQPAIFMHRGPQRQTQPNANGITKIHWKVTVWIYFRTDGFRTVNTYPDELSDEFLDAVEQLFQTNPPLDGRLTLGGTVYHCWIDGDMFFDAGVVDGQGVAIIPLSILM